MRWRGLFGLELWDERIARFGPAGNRLVRPRCDCGGHGGKPDTQRDRYAVAVFGRAPVPIQRPYKLGSAYAREPLHDGIRDQQKVADQGGAFVD
jgi:hypothetical protein